MAKEATTPILKKKEATPSGEKEAITSGKPKEGAENDPSKIVADLQSEVDTLKKQLELQKTLQSQADKKARIERIEKTKLEKQLKSIREGEDFVPPEVPEGETGVEREVRLEARVGIQNLILDKPEYQELIKQDITLKEVLRNNPFALIGDFFDAQDAVEQIKERLEERLSSLKTQPKEGESKKGEKGEEFEAGIVQSSESAEVPPEEEKSSKTLDEKLEESISKKIHIT